MALLSINMLSLVAVAFFRHTLSDDILLNTGPFWVDQLDIQTENSTLNFTTWADNLLDVDFDPVEQVIYWIRSKDNKLQIKNSKLDGSQGINVQNRGAGYPYRIALDPDSRLLFYQDMRGVYKTELDTFTQHYNMSTHVKVVSNSYPDDIALDTVKKELYWVDTNRIWRANYSGMNKQPLLDLGHKSHWTAMAIDSENSVLYFADTSTTLIERINLDGTNRRTIVSDYTTKTSFYAVLATLAYSKGNLYFANRSTENWRQDFLMKVPVTGGLARAIGPPLYTIPSGIHVIPSNNTPDASIKVRLATGRNSGRLEAQINGQWTGVCADNITRNASQVICNSLGFDKWILPKDALRFVNHYGPDAKLHVLRNTICTGSERSLDDCDVLRQSGDTCQGNRDVIIDCGPSLEDIVHLECTTTSWLVTVDMAMLSYKFPGIRASDLYLGANTCTGSLHGDRLMIVEGFNGCLTSETKIKDGIKYTNQLIYATHDSVHPYEVNSFKWNLGLECLDLNNTAYGMLMTYNHSINFHADNNARAYQFQMQYYSDPNFMQVISGSPLSAHEGQNVYVKAYITNADWSVKMKLNTCYTSSTDGDVIQDYFLVKHGCEVDYNTHFISDTMHETKFQFQLFTNKTRLDKVFVHCDPVYCDTSSSPFLQECEKQCNV